MELNFKAAEGDYSPAIVTAEIANDFQYQPLDVAGGTILVLKPEVSNTTKGGIKKSDAQIAEELKKMDYPMTVLASSKAATELGIVPNTKVVVMRFTATNLPSPIEGFDVVFVRAHEVLAIDKTSQTC